MFIRNNFVAVVLLAILILGICGALGFVIGSDPYGPGRQIRVAQAGTQFAVGIPATEAALGAVQTPQAAYLQQTSVASELTAMPMNQTATSVAAVNMANDAQTKATQTALAVAEDIQQSSYQATKVALGQQQGLNQLAYNATATAFVLEPIRNGTKNDTLLILIGVGVLSISVWMVSNNLTRVLKKRTEAKIAQAHLLQAEQRRLKAAQALVISRSTKKGVKNTISPVKVVERGNGHGMPQAE